MNRAQECWWEQAVSDHETFQILRSSGVATCQLLHYLQMATEKIAKAYFWRNNSPPPKSHAGFTQFLRFLGGHVSQTSTSQIASIFGYKRYPDFQAWIKSGATSAYELERLAPSLATNGPNPEYPWPHSLPVNSPVKHNFTIWTTLSTAAGRKLLRFTQTAINDFPNYADL